MFLCLRPTWCDRRHSGFVRSSVCASQNIVNTISCRVFDTFSPNLHQWCWCIMGQMNWTSHSLGSKGQGSRLRWNKVCWKQHFFGLLTQCLEKLDFHQTYTNDVLWDRDERVKFWSQKVTVQGHVGITYAGTITVQAEAYITRRLVTCVELRLSSLNNWFESLTLVFFYIFCMPDKSEVENKC